MPDPETLDPASLDTFTTSLIEAGFVRDADGQTWRGPIHPALRRFTNAQEMRVVIRDGWPFLHPRTYADGIPNGLHRNTAGDVCLWDDGDPSFDWLTWGGISERIEHWTQEAQGTGTAEDPGFDPHVHFMATNAGLATIDLSDITIGDWDARDLRATLKDNVLAIGTGDLRGRLYVRERPHLPARTLDDVRGALRRRQQRDLDEQLQTVGQPDGLSFIVLAWATPAGPNLLTLGLSRLDKGGLGVTVYESARTDTAVLQLRAGPDAQRLSTKTAIIFGVGAIGSRIADLLARSGVGTIHVYDTQRLRPGDVVRHAAERIFVGDFKTDAVQFKAMLAAPWSTVRVHRTAPWKPSELAAAIGDADLIVDATGLKPFAAQLSLIAEQTKRPLMSVALYRHGDVGRVRLQTAEPTDRIYDRGEPLYPEVPAGADEAEVAWETGCAAPVAQAPPACVAAISATASRWAVNALCDSEPADADVVEVYRPLKEAPFDVAGTRVIQR